MISRPGSTVTWLIMWIKTLVKFKSRVIRFILVNARREPEPWRLQLGEHTKEVLRETGYTESEIEEMMTAGAVF